MVGSDMPYFKGVPRQRGRGFGALAAVVGRSALPFLAKYVAPIAKTLGKNLVEAALPELVSVVEGKKKIKQAFKDTGKTTIKRQVGRGRKRKRVTRKKPTKIIKKTKRLKNSRSRKDFFKKLKD